MPMPVYVPTQGTFIVPDALGAVPVITPATNAVVITPNNYGPRQPSLVLGVDGATWLFGHGPPTS